MTTNKGVINVMGLVVSGSVCLLFKSPVPVRSGQVRFGPSPAREDPHSEVSWSHWIFERTRAVPVRLVSCEMLSKGQEANP